VKPGVEESPLSELVEFLLERWGGGAGAGGAAGAGAIGVGAAAGAGAGAGAAALAGAAAGAGGAVPAATHRLVAAAFMDLCVRQGLTLVHFSAQLERFVRNRLFA